MAEDWITTTEACEISGYHHDYLRRLLCKGKISAKKWGNTWMVSRASLLEYLRSIELRGGKRGPKPKKHAR